MRRRSWPNVAVILIALALPVPLAHGRQTPIKANTSDLISRLQRIAALISAQDLRRAEAELDAILKINKREAQALNLLGVVRAKQGRSDEAESLFKQSLAVAPRLTGAHLNLGLLYQSQARAEEAATKFEEVLRLDSTRRAVASDLSATLRRLASDAVAAGEHEKALAYLIRARAAAPADPDVLFEFAVTALRLSLYEDAAQALNLALEQRPNEPAFLFALARAQLAVGRVPEAEQLFRRYVALRPADAGGHYGLGYALAILKRGAEAASAFERSIELRPEQTESQYQMGLLASAEGNLDAAAVWFKKVLKRFADHAGATLGLGLVQFNRKQYELARATLERAVSLDSAAAKAHYYLGLTYARLGDKSRATQELALAAKLEREQKDKGRTVLRLLGPESAGDVPQDTPKLK